MNVREQIAVIRAKTESAQAIINTTQSVLTRRQIAVIEAQAREERAAKLDEAILKCFEDDGGKAADRWYKGIFGK